MSFRAHAAAHGLLIRDLIADGRWHRTPTTDKRKSKKNGAYLWDGHRGVVRNWATMPDYAAYREDGSATRVDHAALRELQRRHAAEREQRQAAARELAKDMVSRAVPGPHPYLVTKGFPRETGFVLDDELLIPMRNVRDYTVLNSLQRISADGTKMFLPGGKAAGSVFLIGPFVAQELWLVEGYSTGLSVVEALKDLRRSAQVVVCFSAGNLTDVGRWARNRVPGCSPAFVFADHDASETGASAAKATGLPWTMPPIVAFDANDYHRHYGLRALVKLIRDVEVERESVRAEAGF